MALSKENISKRGVLLEIERKCIFVVAYHRDLQGVFSLGGLKQKSAVC